MKKICLALILLLIFPVFAFAVDVSITVDKTTIEPDLASFTIYKNGTELVNITDLTLPYTYVDSDVPDGTYDYTATFTDATGNESTPSNPVTAYIDTIAPAGGSDISIHVVIQ